MLSIWDTCGNEIELKVLPSNIYKIASAFLVVCSYDNKDSIFNLKSWIEHILSYLNNRNQQTTYQNIPIIIVINKSDIHPKQRLFKISDVVKITDEYNLNILVHEASAKDNIKIDYIFEKLVVNTNGRVSALNETGLNSTFDNRSTNRRKSFQLNPSFTQEIKSPLDRLAKKNGSCCNN
jgi:GTPase SAR1 family protein